MIRSRADSLPDRVGGHWRSATPRARARLERARPTLQCRYGSRCKAGPAAGRQARHRGRVDRRVSAGDGEAVPPSSLLLDMFAHGRAQARPCLQACAALHVRVSTAHTRDDRTRACIAAQVQGPAYGRGAARRSQPVLSAPSGRGSRASGPTVAGTFPPRLPVASGLSPAAPDACHAAMPSTSPLGAAAAGVS